MEMIRCAVLVRPPVAAPSTPDSLDLEGLLLSLDLEYTVEEFCEVTLFAVTDLKTYLTADDAPRPTTEFDWPVTFVGNEDMTTLRTRLGVTVVNEVFCLADTSDLSSTPN